MSGGRQFALLAVAAAACVPTMGRAQEGQSYSLDQVAEAVAADLGTRILERARVGCVSFIVDATTERRLRAAGAEADFTAALRDVCYKGTSLEVTTAPAGAEVWVQDRRVGTSPWTSPMPVVRNAVVEVRSSGQSRRVTTDMVADSLVSIHLAMPRDTASLPPPSPASELQSLRAQAGDFDARSRPRPPSPPVRGSGVVSAVVGGLVGAAAGVAAGTLLCRRNVTSYVTDTIAGVVFQTPAGTTTELSGGCLGFSVGGAAAAGGLAGNLWSGAGVGRRRRRYDEDLRIHERQLARWEQQRMAAELLRQREAGDAERERTIVKNAEIRAANRNLGEPRISVVPAIRLSRPVLNDASP